MGKSKKISFTSIAIVVLAILLTVSLTMGGTLAWFANQNSAGTTLTMGNAVGVAVVDNVGNGSMDRLSFNFNTGRNGELMLPGTQIDPDVRALVAKSNTSVILRAVITFEVTVDPRIYSATNQNAENKTELEKAAGTALVPATTYNPADTSGKYWINVPSLVADDAATAAFGTAKRELYLLNQMYTSFFGNLQNSALYNGWVYRESNYNTSGVDKVTGGSTKLATDQYYISGATQYSNTPLPIGRNAGPSRTQPNNSTGVEALDPAAAVAYNAFYFRGWADDKGQLTGETALTTAGLTAGDAFNATTGDGWKVDDRGIDGTYVVKYSKGSRTGTEKYVPGTGRQYYYNRFDAAAGCEVTDEGEYEILEGTFSSTNATFTRVADPLGYKAGDFTANGGSSDSFTGINVSTATVNATGQATTINKSQDSWQSSGVQEENEDMMCVLNTNAATARVPLFTTSFVLPTTWTQDAFADRSIRLNITFQVMQSDYLASGSSHHCSVELAESRFDDVTVWPTAGGTSGTGNAYVPNQPYVKDVNNLPDFDNPDFWNSNPYEYDDDLVVPPTPAA